ncbi:MAG: MaoC family dehydratase N-terminal domain-containing protein [Mycolicibacterium hassiacum]|jgi:acyl dehydratase|uniref:FAS1-like dehydratase domain-containing protein n=1 Tax=Mycolicibacterium hassiacum TaxID=46351 RepID=UPI0023F700B6|nr:MaoC family dehydratase N-terminal domain-containing protein [Mycolicibacterium hassiacum]MBX5486383.1 MaoC family dehydratase N-terminal domain-containing protein [Mycolicibacterium hassiacum]
MSTTNSTDNETAVIEGRITDEDIERAKAQIGIPVYSRDVPWNKVPTSDSISHFAWGCGDDNPLFHDPAYGANTRWHDQIASPTFPIATGLDQTPKFTDPERKKLFRGLFRGTGKYYSGVKWTWYQPVYPGRPVLQENYTLDVEVKESQFAGGRSVKETFRYLYVDISGNPIATRDESYINAERHGSKKAGKYSHIERQRWTPEQLEEIEKTYEAEQRRGADPRWWEDVNVGDELPTVVKGPLTVVDIISMHMGWGWGGYGVGPLKYAHQLRKRMPAFFVPDQYGVPDIVQRLHWDADRAAELGLPAPYDYGQMRAAWITHLLTNWIGDDGWLTEMDIQMRGFNYHGDVHWCRGRVVAKGETPDDPVTIEVSATNQRDETTTKGTAKVLLPSRKTGAVVLPVPDVDLRRRGAQVASRVKGKVGEELRRLYGE